MREILAQRGLSGILELSERGNASWVIGALSRHAVLSDVEIQDLLRLALVPILAGKKETHSHANLIAGATRSLLDDDKREAILKGVAEGLSGEHAVQLLVLAPFRSSTWKLVDLLGEAAQANYWSQVTPDWIHGGLDAENNEGVERLLKAGRPRAAFSCIRLEPGRLDAQLLVRLLSDMASGSKEQAGQYMLEQYNVEEAFKHLNNSSVLTLEQKAGLEFAYIDVLSRPWGARENYGIPNLERYVELHPELFVQSLAWTYKRKDGAADPAELQLPPDRVGNMAERGYKLLSAIERIPGHNDLGELETKRLSKWIATVRQLSADLSRSEIADVSIGNLLSRAPVGKDGVWPCEEVRDVMEEIQSEAMMRGAHTGVYNSRGAHWRGEGGDQERDLADQYRKWAEALQISHPFVASKLLMGLAQTYDREAGRQDTEASMRRRLR